MAILNPVAACKEPTCQLCWVTTFICWKIKRPFTVSNCVYKLQHFFFTKNVQKVHFYDLKILVCISHIVSLFKTFTKVLKVEKVE